MNPLKLLAQGCKILDGKQGACGGLPMPAAFANFLYYEAMGMGVGMHESSNLKLQ